MASGDRPRVRLLAIDTHWSSARGGVSTFNRELCLALARAGADVCCLVLEASPEEVSTAGDLGVRLIGAGMRPGWDEDGLLMLRPRLPEGWLPQVIIGHGRVTGRFADAHREDRFGGAAYFHFVHTDPQRLGGERAESKWEEELPLMARADRVLAVGPALWRRAENDLRPLPGASVPIQIDPGFDLVGPQTRCPPAGGARKVLVAGRLEDHAIKGLDIAARAVAGAISLCRSTRGVGLILRGVPTAERAKTETRMIEWAGIDLDIDLHRYSVNPQDVRHDLGRSVLVLMPSRTEGFGLAGQEAIVAGVPVLVSEHSGLGELLCDEAADIAGGMVLQVRRDGGDVQHWSRAIAAVLDDPVEAFARAAELREWMSGKRTWAEAAERVLQAWAVAPRRIGRRPAEKLLNRTILTCADGAAAAEFLNRLGRVLRDMIDHFDPKPAPEDGTPAAWSCDLVLCVLGEDNRGGGAAAMKDILTDAHRLQLPVVLLRISPGATPPPGRPDGHMIDATGDFLETLERLSEHLAGFAGHPPAMAEGPEPVVVPAARTADRREFLPVNEMPAIASTKFHDRADTVELVLGALVKTKYRLIVMTGQDGVGKTAVVRAIRDGQEKAEKPSLRSLVYFSARGFRWISASALLADLAGLAEEADRETLLTEVRTAPWEAVVDKVLAMIGTAPVAVVIDDADRLFDRGGWTDLDLKNLIAHVVDKGDHPVSVLMLVREVPTALAVYPLQRRMLPVPVVGGLPFRPYAKDLMRGLDDEAGTLGLAAASTAQLERLHHSTGGLPRSMELVAALLSLNHSETVDRVADLLDGAADPPRVLFTEVFGRLALEARRVLQALAVFVRPVSADAVTYLLAEVHPTLRAAASLAALRRARVVYSYGDRYYLPASQGDLALSTLPSEESAGPASPLTKEHLRRRGVEYFRSRRRRQVDAIGDVRGRRGGPRELRDPPARGGTCPRHADAAAYLSSRLLHDHSVIYVRLGRGAPPLCPQATCPAPPSGPRLVRRHAAEGRNSPPGRLTRAGRPASPGHRSDRMRRSACTTPA